MKIYRLDCSGSYRLVFQIKNYKLFTRLREWYKFKRRVNRLTKRDASTIYHLVHEEIVRVEERIVKEGFQFNSMSAYYLN